MRKGRVFMPCLLLLVLFVSALAQETDLKKYPGYVNLEEIQIPDKAGDVTEVTLGPALLKLASMVEDDEDEDLDEALSNIHGIQIKTFDIDSSDAVKIQPIMDKIEANLNRDGWERLVQVKGEDERVIVSTKFDDGRMVGFFVMSLEPGDEAAFINIIGEISLDTIENLDINLDDSALDSIKKTLKKK
jgi:hypothetical protein